MPEAEKKSDPVTEEKTVAEAPKRKKSLASMGLFGGVMLVEGVAIFFFMKFLGSEPDPTVGMEQTLATTTAPFEESKEIEIGQVRVQNANGAHTMLYSVKVTVRVNFEKEQMVDEFLENRRATIDDTISRIIRSADEKNLSEPGLETLKRQLRYELSTLLGDDTIIEQVLIPEFTPLPTGF